MTLEKSHHYVFRIGSDNQIRVHWDGSGWHYEFLAGGVIFDTQHFHNDQELEDAVSSHGLTLEQFEVDETGDAAAYSVETRKKMEKLTALGIKPCPKHGLSAMNLDGTCEACHNPDYFDDFKGTEG